MPAGAVTGLIAVTVRVNLQRPLEPMPARAAEHLAEMGPVFRRALARSAVTVAFAVHPAKPHVPSARSVMLA